MEQLIGQSLGPDNKYTLVSLLGRGGMSAVFKAQQSRLRRNVAIKVLDPALTRDAQFIQRFTNEARVVANLEHWNILPVYDFGQEDDLFYIVMRMVDGGTLKERFTEENNQPWPPRRVLPLMTQVLSALDYAHARHVIHRDVKPHNILLEGNHPFLADFGLAKLLQQDAELTQTGLLLGTPAYMSPEQVLGDDLDSRSDLYSCAVVLYQLLTGRVPFRAETPNSAFQHVYSPMPRPIEVNPDLRPRLEAVLLKALSRERAQRFATGAAFSAALEQAIVDDEQTPIVSQPVQLLATGTAGQQTSATLPPLPQRGNSTDQPAAHRSTAEPTEIHPVGMPNSVPEGPTSRSAGYGAASTPSQGAEPANPPAVSVPRRRRRLWPGLLTLLGVVIAASIAFVVLDGRAWWQRAGDIGQSSPSVAASATGESNVTTSDQPSQASHDTTSQPGSTTQGEASAATSPSQLANPSQPAGALAETSLAAASDAGPAPSGVPLRPPEGSLVYDDDFSNGLQTSGLYGEVTKTGFSSGIHDPGVFHFKVPDPDTVNFTALPRFATRDFTLEIDVWDNSDEFSGGIALGSMFRVRDANHYYALLLNPRTQQYAVRKLNGESQWEDLIPWKDSLLIKRTKEVNHLRIDARGDTFTVYLNGEYLDQFIDGDFPFGMLGMIAVNIDANQPHMHFDNINVWSSDPIGAATSPTIREDPAGAMVLIPAGEFIMGSNEGSVDQPHMVDLPDYFIDQREVTNALYRTCVEAGGCTPQLVTASETHPNYANQPLYDAYPVMQVTWTQAQAFCGWAGKRLPSEAEWEKAASWNSATNQKVVWPWGNIFDKSLLNSDESGNHDTTAEDAYPPELNGTVAMAGNVAEWTNSAYVPFPYDASDGREDPGAQGDRVFRGGSWAQTWGKARSFVRQQATPTYAGREIGFRCAATP